MNDDPRHIDNVLARRAFEQAERDLLRPFRRDIDGPRQTPVGMLMRALRDNPPATSERTTVAPTTELKHAPEGWVPGVTRVRHADGRLGTYVGAEQTNPTPDQVDERETDQSGEMWTDLIPRALVRFVGEEQAVDVDPDVLTAITHDPFAGIASRVPTRLAPGATGVPYDYARGQDWWVPVIFYCAGEVVKGEGTIWLVEPYPAERADGTDGLDPVDSATVAVVRGSAFPHPRVAGQPDGDWIIPARYKDIDNAYEAHVSDQTQAMAAWCEAYAIATAMNNGTTHKHRLAPQDVQVLLAAERCALITDSAAVNTEKFIRYTALGDPEITDLVPRDRWDWLVRWRKAIEPYVTRRVDGSIITTYGLTALGAKILDDIRAQDDGPVRCGVCGCWQDRACTPVICSWVDGPASRLCTACVSGGTEQ